MNRKIKLQKRKTLLRPLSGVGVYLDHAAATPLDPRVKKAMEPFWGKHFGNPSSPHEFGKIAREALDASRKNIAKILGCRSDEIIFTGSGTESNNAAIFGIARALKAHVIPSNHKPHIITTTIEHESVLEPCRVLERSGFAVTYLPVDKYGWVNPELIEKSLRPETIFVSVMYANNEIGTIEPIKEISKIIADHNKQPGTKHPNIKTVFHTDACQAAGYLNINVEYLGVDLLTLNGSKVYGPKGVGMLYKKRGIELEPFVYGGGQEEGVRSGTEHIPAIVGLSTALQEAHRMREKESKRLRELSHMLGERLLTSIPKTVLHGPSLATKKTEARLPHNINISFLGIDAELLIAHLEKHKIYVSSGSACASRNKTLSHVLKAIGRSEDFARSAIRITLGRETKRADITTCIKTLERIVKQIRS